MGYDGDGVGLNVHSRISDERLGDNTKSCGYGWHPPQAGRHLPPYPIPHQKFFLGQKRFRTKLF